ncbi:MAG: hypothetical protein OHK0013_07450 [Sandaracinaceae bacterium]
MSSPADPERLAYDRSEADVATLRRVAIGVVVVSAASVAALAQTWWAYLVAGASLVAVRFWARKVSDIHARAPALRGRALVLSDEALEIPTERGEAVRLAWREVEGIEIDHDRLVVVIRTRNGEWELEPSFGNLGLDDLARRLDARRARARR